MDTLEGSHGSEPEERLVPPWKYAIVSIGGFSLAHGVLPFALSLLARRHGWTRRRPGRWNLFGLLPVLGGAAFAGWGLALHSMEGFKWEPSQRYLLRRGPYRFSRNPMYVGIISLWLGWAILFGSFSVLMAFIAWTVGLDRVVVPMEERALEARHADAYVEYRNRVPRWLGSTRSSSPPFARPPT